MQRIRCRESNDLRRWLLCSCSPPVPTSPNPFPRHRRPPPGIGVSVADNLWGPGDTIRMTLGNWSDSLLGFGGDNPCDVALERRQNDKGTPVHHWPPCYPNFCRCTSSIRTTVEWPVVDTASVDIVTNGFRVVGD